MMNTRLLHYRRWMVLFAALIVTITAGAQSPISVNIAVEKQEVHVGEAFIFRIVVDGTHNVEAPNLAALTSDFNVEFTGGKTSSSTSVTSINGQRTNISKRTYTMDYRLRALRTGSFNIPATQVIADGKPFNTRPVPINVLEAQKSDDFFLTTEVSKSTCYVGEAIELKTTYIIGKQPRNLSFSMPVLNLDTIIASPLSPNRVDFELELGNDSIQAEQGSITRNGETFATLSFRHALVPQKPGTLELPECFVSFEAPTGRHIRTRSLFGGVQQEHAAFVVSSDPITLSVKPLPDAGKPQDFSGLVGAFEIATTASPTKVNVGDPITLRISIAGSALMDHVALPPLQQSDLAANFRISEEMAPGVIEANVKRFTQTIRAQSAEVTEIPSLSLPYFDTRSGSYAIAKSKAIPIAVQATTMVTAADAQGYNNDNGVETVEHVAVDEGIAHNFTDTSALKSQRFGPNVWLRGVGSYLFLLLPPLLYGFLAAGLFFRARGGIFAIDRSQAQALPVLEARLDSLDTSQSLHGPVLEAIRVYLGTRLHRQASALTFTDAAPLLLQRNISEASREDLKKLFDECEAHHYAGGAGTTAENSDLIARVRATISALNKELK